MASREEAMELVEQLRKRGLSNGSSLGQHSELYEVAADLIEALLQENQVAPREKIAVETPLGRLEACIGGDPENYPVIYTYIVRPDGVEIDLVACEVKIEEDVAQAYLYGDTQTEQWTRSHQWTKDAINIECD